MKKFLYLFCIIFFLTACNNTLIDRLTPGLIAKVDNHKIYLSDIKKRANEDNDKRITPTKPMLIFYINEMIKEIIIEETFKKLGFKITESDQKKVPFMKKLDKNELNRWIMFKKVKKYVVRKLTPPSLAECKYYYKKHFKEYNSSEKVKLEYIIFESKVDAEKFLRKIKKYGFENALKKSGLSLTFKGILNVKNIPDDIKRQVNYTEKNSIWLIKSENKYFYVIKIAEYYKKKIPFNEVKDEISKKILENNRQKLFNLWLKNEIKKRNIKIFYNKLD